jgi:hypothetical protein
MKADLQVSLVTLMGMCCRTSIALALCLAALGSSGAAIAQQSSAGAPATSAQDERLNVRVWPRISSAPAVVRIEVFIDRSEQNRAIEIIVDSGEHYRSSMIPLDGAGAARFHTVTYRSLPAGYYEVQVGVVDQEGTLRAFERHWIDIVQ